MTHRIYIQLFQDKRRHVFVNFKDGLKNVFVFYLLLSKTLSQLL